MIERTPHRMHRMPHHPAAPMQQRLRPALARREAPAVAQMHRARRPAPRIATAPVHAPISVAGPLALSGYDPLGFSLKPPKAIRKAATAIKKAVTIKNVAKVAAVVGTAALVPGLLPAVAKGALAVGKVAVGGAKLLGKGAVAAERAVVRNVGTAAGIVTGASNAGKNNPPGGDSAPSVLTLTEDAVAPVASTAPVPSGGIAPAPTPPAVAQDASGNYNPATGAPLSSGAAGGSPDDSPAATAPTQAGFGGMAVPLAIAGVAAVLFLARKPRRSRS